jgi:hypothetical protein
VLVKAREDHPHYTTKVTDTGHVLEMNFAPKHVMGDALDKICKRPPYAQDGDEQVIPIQVKTICDPTNFNSLHGDVGEPCDSGEIWYGKKCPNMNEHKCGIPLPPYSLSFQNMVALGGYSIHHVDPGFRCGYGHGKDPWLPPSGPGYDYQCYCMTRRNRPPPILKYGGTDALSLPKTTDPKVNITDLSTQESFRYKIQNLPNFLLGVHATTEINTKKPKEVTVSGAAVKAYMLRQYIWEKEKLDMEGWTMVTSGDFITVSPPVVLNVYEKLLYPGIAYTLSTQKAMYMFDLAYSDEIGPNFQLPLISCDFDPLSHLCDCAAGINFTILSPDMCEPSCKEVPHPGFPGWAVVLIVLSILSGGSFLLYKRFGDTKQGKQMTAFLCKHCTKLVELKTVVSTKCAPVRNTVGNALAVVWNKAKGVCVQCRTCLNSMRTRSSPLSKENPATESLLGDEINDGIVDDPPPPLSAEEQRVSAIRALHAKKKTTSPGDVLDGPGEGGGGTVTPRNLSSYQAF